MFKKRIAAFCLALLMGLSGAVALASGEQAIVTAGNCSRTVAEAQAYFDLLYAQYADYYAGLGYPMTDEDILYIRDQVMSTYAFFAVMDNKVEEYGVGEITDADKATLMEEAQKSFDESVESYIVYYMETFSTDRATAEAATVAELELYGLTVQTTYDSLLLNLPYDRLYDVIIQDVTVDDAAIDAAYAAMVAEDEAEIGGDVTYYEIYTGYYGEVSYFIPDGFRYVKHILLEIPEDIAGKLVEIEEQMYTLDDAIAALLYEKELPADKLTRAADDIQKEIDDLQAEYDALAAESAAINAEASATLEPIIAEINAKLAEGVAFDDLITEYNTDQGMAYYPEGYMVHKDSILWDPIFRDAAMALENIGDVSAPVYTSFGVHIIKYLSDAPAGAVPLTDELRASMRTEMLASAQNDAFAIAVEVWHQAYPVEAHPELIVLPKTV